MLKGNWEPGEAMPDWLSQSHFLNFILIIYYKDVILLPSSYKHYRGKIPIKNSKKLLLYCLLGNILKTITPRKPLG